MANNARVLSQGQVEKVLESILKDENITNPIIKIDDGSKKGNGYMSFLTKVDVIDKNNKEVHLMIKVAPSSEEFRQVMPIRKVYLRELYFYGTVMKEFNEFQKERGFTIQPIVPKCFKTSEDEGEELIVMENIKFKGFRMWIRSNQMDEEHVNMALKHFATYHALSYAFKDHNPAKYQEIAGNMKSIYAGETFSIGLYNRYINNVKKATSIFDPHSEKDFYDKIQKFIEGLENYFVSLETFKSKNSVITHGDSWCNNMMFKYEDDNLKKPKEMIIYDFQIAQEGSPMADLSYFFHPSAPKTILYNYKHHLSIYYENLKKQYLKMGGRLENLPTFDALHEEWKMFTKYGYTMALTVFKAMLCDDDEAFDFSDAIENNINFMDIFSRKLKKEDVFEEMVKVLTRYMNDHGFLN